MCIRDSYNTPLFWWLFFGPLLLIPLIIIVTRNRGKRALDIEGIKIRKTNKLARKYLSSSKKAIGNKEAFYVALERALHNYLKSKLKIETSDFSKDKIDQLFAKKEVHKDATSQFLDVLKSCELARYTPLGVADMERDYQKAVETINTLDKQLK